MQKFGYRQLKRAGTQTNAANRYKSELSKEQSFRLVDLFEKDFEFFGYSKDIDSDKISIYKEASCVRGIDQKFVLSTFLRYATVFPADGCLPHCRDKITKGLSSIFSIIVKNSSSQMSGVAGVSLPNHLIPLHLLLMPAYGQVHRFNEIIYNMLFSQLPTQDVEQNDFHAVLAYSRESGDFESFFYYKQLSLYASKLGYDNCLHYNEEGGNIKLSFRQTTNSGISHYYHSGMSVK